MSEIPKHTEDPMYFVHNKDLPLADRFWAKVERLEGRDSCWIWRASEAGGRLQIGSPGSSGRRVLDARHFAWELMTGEPWPHNYRHGRSCGNKMCVRGSHIRPVPPGEVLRDMRRERMLFLRSRGFSLEDIGQQYGISKERARQIVGNAWPSNSVCCTRPGWKEIIANLHFDLGWTSLEGKPK